MEVYCIDFCPIYYHYFVHVLRSNINVYLCFISSGGIALDPSHFKTANATAKLEADLLHKACADAGEWVATLQPELIVLSTPHGIADLNNFAFYLNSMVHLTMIGAYYNTVIHDFSAIQILCYSLYFIFKILYGVLRCLNIKL